MRIRDSDAANLNVGKDSNYFQSHLHVLAPAPRRHYPDPSGLEAGLEEARMDCPRSFEEVSLEAESMTVRPRQVRSFGPLRLWNRLVGARTLGVGDFEGCML
jgi:hypothetical protein